MSTQAKIVTATRLLLGVVFFVFGLNGFLNFLPQPPVSDRGLSFLGALGATGYMFPLIKGVEVLGGVALLSHRFVPLALTVLAPIVVNIVAFHLVLSPGAFPILALLVGGELFLAWAYRDSFRAMLRHDARPVRDGEVSVAVSAKPAAARI